MSAELTDSEKAAIAEQYLQIEQQERRRIEIIDAEVAAAEIAEIQPQVDAVIARINAQVNASAVDLLKESVPVDDSAANVEKKRKKKKK